MLSLPERRRALYETLANDLPEVLKYLRAALPRAAHYARAMIFFVIFLLLGANASRAQQAMPPALEALRGSRSGQDDIGEKTDSAANSPGTKGKDSPTPADRGKSGLTLVRVPGGTFTMGCQDGRDSDCYNYLEKPAHAVTVSGFQIGKYEVTQADWRSVTGENPSNFSGCDDCPVEKVSWDDVQDFLKKLNAQEPGKNYRLPTEAEWEYAARGGAKSKGYLYAGGNDLDKVAWYDGNSGDKTHPVGGKAPNELGLYDVSGNVWEWCSDWYGDYSATVQNDPKGPDQGDHRVFRGGSWYDYAKLCRVSDRNCRPPGYRSGFLGFRLAASPPG